MGFYSLWGTRRQLNSENNWIKQIGANAQTNVLKVWVGNNCDIPDGLATEEEGKKLADDFNMSFLKLLLKLIKMLMKY